jgi:hypothetical protein
VPELQRLTTEYVDTEDRLRLTGEIRPGETTVLWLSQRLLLRLLPPLFLWLEKQSVDGLPLDIAQGFAQQAAQANLSPEAPVARAAQSQEWLVEAVDLSPKEDILTLQFRAQPPKAVTLSMSAQALRQWLNILHTLWGLAEWPIGIWPQWMADSKPHTSSTNAAIH